MNRPQSSNSNVTSKNRVGNVSRSIKEIYAELGRVTWPTKKDTVTGALMVFVLASLAAVFFLILDQIMDLMFCEYVRNMYLFKAQS